MVPIIPISKNSIRLELIKIDYFNSVWRFEICGDSPIYGLVYGWRVGVSMGRLFCQWGSQSILHTGCLSNGASYVQRSSTVCSLDNFVQILHQLTLKYKQDPVMQLYGAQFPKHHEHMIWECIDIMENECRSKHYITFQQKYGSTVDMLTKTVCRIKPGNWQDWLWTALTQSEWKRTGTFMVQHWDPLCVNCHW